MIKRILVFFFAALLIFSALLPVCSLAADYTDHWAAESIGRAVQMGWFADGNNTRPNEPVTRAEFVTMINRMQGYTGTADLSGYSDISRSDWYYDMFSTAVAQGYIQGAEGKLNPRANITRNEAVTIFARISGLNTAADYTGVLSNIYDAKSIPDWAKPYAGAAVSAGLIAGSNGSLNGGSNITRAETAVLLERIYDGVRTYGFAGTYTCTANSVVVYASGVTLRDCAIAGDVTIDKAVGDGEVTLDTVDVAGKLDARGGGMNSIYVIRSNIPSIVLSKNQVRVVLKSGCEVSSASIDSENCAIVVENGANVGSVNLEAPYAKVNMSVGAAVTSMTVDSKASGTDIKMDSGSRIINVIIAAANVGLTLNQGSAISDLNISETAGNARVDNAAGSNIDSATVSATGAVISGTGNVASAVIKAEKVVIESKPGAVAIDKGIIASVGGKQVKDNGTVVASTSSSSTGSGSSTSGGSSADSGGSTGGGSSTGGGGDTGGGNGGDNTTYTVTYNSNGADGGTVPTDTEAYASGTSVTVKANDGGLVKTGSTFSGWNTAADGTGTAYAAGTGTFIITGDTTLYAMWTEVKESPVLTEGSVEALVTASGSTATLRFTSGVAGTYYYLILPYSANAPDAAAIIAQGAADTKGSGAATAGENTVFVTGLIPKMTYKAYIVVVNSEGGVSEVLTIGNVNPARIYTISITAEGDAAGDSVMLSAISGREGDTITISYTLAYSMAINMLTFDGIAAKPPVIDRAATDSWTYSVADADAVNGVITITAVFVHLAKTPDTMAFDPVVKTYGDAPFTNVFKTTPAGDGAVTYVSGNTNVATVTDAGEVTIVGAGTATITANKIEGTDHAPVSANYNLTVNPKQLTADAPTGTLSRVYDGTTALTLTPGTLSGIIGNDDVTLSISSAYFDNKNVGDNKIITAVFDIGGEKSANYIKPVNDTSLRGSITAKHIAVSSITAQSKVYDGTTSATVSNVSLDGVIGMDDVTANGSGAVFDDENVGDGITVTCSSFSLGGADGVNYTVGQTAQTTTASITKANVTVSAITIASAHSGDSFADVTLGDVTVSGVNGETFTGTWSYTVPTAAAGTANATADAVFTVNGGTADISNYNMPITKTVTFTLITGPLPAPTSPAKTAYQITLNWTAATDAAGVEIWQKTPGGQYAKSVYAEVLNAASTSAVITGLSPNTAYTFMLVITGGHYDGNSEELTVTTDEIPVNVTSGTVTPNAFANNSIRVTLTNGSFISPSSLTINNFTISGQSELTTANWYMKRLSDTEAVFSLRSGSLENTPTAVTVLATALLTGSSQTTAAVTAENYVKLSGNIGSGASGVSNEGLRVNLYAAADITLTSLLGSALTDTLGGFVISDLHPAGDYVLVLEAYPNSRLEMNSLTGHVTNADFDIVLPQLATPTDVILRADGTVGWTEVTQTTDVPSLDVAGVAYDVKLYKGNGTSELVNSYVGASNGVSVLAAMHSNRGASVTQGYTVTVSAKKTGYSSATSIAPFTNAQQTIKPVQAVNTVNFNSTAKKISWMLASDGGLAPYRYVVRIYRDTTVVENYFVEAGTLEIDIADFLNTSTAKAAGSYTATVQPMAERDGGTGEQAGFEGSYVTLAYDGVESAAGSMFTVAGDVNITLAAAGNKGSGHIVAPAFDPDISRVLKNTEIIITAKSGVTVTGADANPFNNTYTGYKVSGWSIAGNSDSTNTKISTAGLNAPDTQVKLSVGAFEEGSLTVTATYGEVNAVPFILAEANTGHLSNLTAGVDIVPDSDFANNKTVYFVTSLTEFSFVDNSRGSIEIFSYTYSADSGKWTVTSSVSTYEGFITAVNGTGNEMAKYTDVVRITGDITGTGTSLFIFSETSLLRGGVPLTITGDVKGGVKPKLDFGLKFDAGVENITIQKLELDLAADKGAGDGNNMSAVFFEGGGGNTLDDMILNISDYNDAKQPVFIGSGISGTVTVSNSVITAPFDVKPLSHNGAGIYVAPGITGGKNTFDKVIIRNNDIAAYRPLALSIDGVEITDGNKDNVSGNTFSGKGDNQGDVTVFNLVTYIKPTVNDVQDIAITEYFGGKSGAADKLEYFFDELANDIEGFVLHLSGSGVAGEISSAVLEKTAAGWNILTYANMDKLANDTGFESASYNTATGVLTIATTGTKPVGATVDINKIVLFGVGLRLAPQGGYTEYNGTGGMVAGQWSWSGNTLTVKLSGYDMGQVNGHYAAGSEVYISLQIYADPGWNTAANYNNSGLTGIKTLTVSK